MEMSIYSESTTAVTDAAGHVSGHTDVHVARDGQPVKRSRMEWEKDAPGAPLRVIQALDDTVADANAAQRDASTAPAAAATAAAAATPLIKRVMYRLRQAPEGPDFAAFLRGVAQRYNVLPDAVTATRRDGVNIRGDEAVDDMMEHFLIHVKEASGSMKSWETWFEDGGDNIDDDAHAADAAAAKQQQQQQQQRRSQASQLSKRRGAGSNSGRSAVRE